MQVVIRGKNLEVTDALRLHVEKKIGKIDKFVDAPLNAQVNMYVERGRHIVEVTASVNGLVLRGEESTTDMYASVDLVVDKLEKQVQKYKARLRRRDKENEPTSDENLFPDDMPPHDAKIVKTKRFPIKPLALDEAIMQMDLLSHDFFVFANADTDRINVLYRRKDGNYGLLEPEH